MQELCVTPTITDKLLARAYLKFDEEGTLPIIYYQGVPTIKQFIDSYMEPGKRIALGCFCVRDKEEPEFCGMGWVSDAVRMNGYTKAETGIGMFKSQKDKTNNLKFGRMMFDRFFSADYQIDCLFGMTPEANKLALRFARQLGMSLHGPVPDLVTWLGKPAPGWISHLSKQDWIDRNRS